MRPSRRQAVRGLLVELKARPHPPEAVEVTTRSSVALMPQPRFAFAGTPEFAARALTGLLQGGFRPCLVLTGPDQRRGRGRKHLPSPVKQLATESGIPVETPADNDEAVSVIEGQRLDTVVVAAYGLILSERFLKAPRHGCINLHASLLPRWRGAAPIERALMAGDAQTGATIMQIDTGLDTGPIIAQAPLPIGPDSTGESLSDAIADLGAGLLCGVLSDLPAMRPEPQSGPATYARKLSPDDAVADWAQPATQLERNIRALAHRLPVHSELGGTRVQLLAGEAQSESAQSQPGEIVMASRQGLVAACGTGTLKIKQLRLDRGKGTILGAAEAINGFGDLFRTGNRFKRLSTG
ncbi:MAG: methionyl-tRNA formyltransferase [Gammaproteobacteria bacterium]|nr:methionyl-tRNA formyltransferase [Gammaproteobacteria bacterium]